MKNVFEEAYNRNTGEIISLSKIKSLFESNTERYYNEIQPYLYCPECEEAHLIYVNRRPNGYLKARSVEEHSDLCSEKYEIASKQILYSTYVNGTEQSKDEIFLKLTNLLNQIYRHNTSNSILTANSVIMTTNKKDNIKSQVITSYKRIPRKNINLPFTENDIDEYKMYYGEAIITQSSNKNLQKYYLHLFNENGSKICDIDMSMKVGEHVASKFSQLIGLKTKIAVFGEYNKYNCIHIKHSKFIKIIL